MFNNEFTKSNYFITGIMFGIISLIRLNNAASIIGFCLFYFFFLLSKKRFKELLTFIIFFMLGILIIYIPIFIFFFKQNALIEMIQGTFLFNFTYVNNNFDESKLLYFFMSLIPFCFFITNISKTNYNREIKICISIITFINILFIGLGELYLHYFVLLTPVITIFFSSIDFKEIYKHNLFLLLIFCVIFVYFYFYTSAYITEHENYNNSNISKYDVLDIKKHIPKNASLIAYDTPAKIYLDLNILPSYKYFTFQSWHSSFNPQIAHEINNELLLGEINYIIVQKNYDILNDYPNYSILYSNNSFDLYKKK